MNVSIDKFKSGVADYVDNELCSKLSDYRKWLLPFLTGMYLNKIDEFIHTNEDHLKKMGCITDDHMIDIGEIYGKLYDIAEHNGSISQSIPVIGEITFNYDDVNKLYRSIIK